MRSITILRIPRVRALALEYLGVVVASLVAIWTLYGLYGVSLKSPLVNLADDGISTQAVVFKGSVDNVGIWGNKYLGAPFGLDLRDVPTPEALVWTVTKLLTLFTDNHVLIRNLVVLGSFPFMAAVSLYAMRRLGHGYLVSLTTSLLFAFSTFHHCRSSAHTLFAIGYFTIPVVTVLAVDLVENKPLFFETRTRWYKPRWLNSGLTWVTLAWCIVVGLTGSVYYPFYSCFLLLIASLFAASLNRSYLPVLRGLVAVATICSALVVGLLPTIWNNLRHGAVPVIIRRARDSETYGLKLVQLILPNARHRLPTFSQLGTYYNTDAPLVNENSTSYIGLVGVIGLFVLLGVALCARRANKRLQLLSVLTVSAILLGTIGGFSSLFAFLVSPTIRSHNRISVYVGFFSLLAVAVVLERLKTRFGTTRARRWIGGSALVGTTSFGLFDQCPASEDYRAFEKPYLDTKAFVSELERSVPLGSSIYQFPYFPFPEHSPIRGLREYALFVPYLHSKTLKWSYGSVKGRRGDAWNKWIASLPPAEAAKTLSLAGFSGIYVARSAYRDNGAALERALSSVLGSPDLTSTTPNASFFLLEGLTESLEDSLGQEEFRARKADVLTPPYFGWLDGFYPPRRDSSCGRRSARLVIQNPRDTDVLTELQAHVTVVHPPATVRFRSDVLKLELAVDGKGAALSTKITVPPGEHFVEVETLGAQDPFEFGRRIRVCINDVSLREVAE